MIAGGVLLLAISLSDLLAGLYGRMLTTVAVVIGILPLLKG